jgi:zona occludens toxin (predicted ATPase)
MRWKADLPKMPRLPKVPVEAGDPAPDALGPPPAPSAYRAKNPYESQPTEYKAPSMLVEHRGLALLFLVAVIAFALYCWKAPHRTAVLDAPAAPGAAETAGATQTAGGTQGAGVAQPPAAAPAQSPIYVEAVPDKDR